MPISKKVDSLAQEARLGISPAHQPLPQSSGDSSSLPWSATQRGGTVKKYIQATEAAGRGSFIVETFRLALKQNMLSTLVYIIIIALLYIICTTDNFVERQFVGLMRAVFASEIFNKYLMWLVGIGVMILIFDTVVGGGKIGFFWWIRPAFNLARGVLRLVNRSVHQLSKSIEEGAHDAILLSGKGNSDREIPVHTYLLQRFDNDAAPQSDHGNECWVRMVGNHKAGQPQETDIVIFEGRLNRDGVFVSSYGKFGNNNQPIRVELPRGTRRSR